MVTNNANNEKTAASGKVLQGQGVGTTSDFSTATYPSATVGTGKILYDNGTNFVTSTPTFPASTSATSGKFIQSDGTNWVASTPTIPTTAGTSGKILISDGTNFVSSTPTYPNTSGTAGKVVISDGTNNVYSTPTFPNASATSGKVIQSDGTNWVASSVTYPSSSGGSGKIIYDNGTNFVESTPTFPASASATSRKIIVSDGTNWVASTETYATPGTSGNVLTSDGTNWTSAAVTAGGGVLTATGTLTNSQIKNLHATPITVIAAPGSGKFCRVISCAAKLDYGGSNVFTNVGGTTLPLCYNGNASFAPVALLLASDITNNANVTRWTSPANGSFASANLENQTLQVFNSTATEIAGNAANDNTIGYSIQYVIETI